MTRPQPTYDPFDPQVIRDSVITLAQDLGVPVFIQPLSREWLYRADEVFLSTTIAEVIPVRDVDGRAIGTDCPGPFTHDLQSAFFETTRGRGRRSSEWLEWVWGSFVGM